MSAIFRGSPWGAGGGGGGGSGGGTTTPPISGLNALTLSNSTIPERSARGTVIGNIIGQTAGSTISLDQNEFRFTVSGTQLKVGPWLLDQGTALVQVFEVYTSGGVTLSKVNTLSITVTQDNAIAAVTPTVWVAPSIQGTGDGLTAANAKAITAVVGTLSAGAVVGVRADLGTYNVGLLTITSSGASGNPIKWIGVDANGRRKLALFTAGRWPYRKLTRDPEEVTTLFTLADSAIQGGNTFQFGAISWVDFEDLAFEDVGVVFNQAGGNPSNLNFRRIHAHNVQRLYEHTSASGHSNLNFDAFVAFMFSKSLIRFRGTASNLTIQNGYADAQRVDNDQWSSLSQVDNTATGLTLTNTVMLNSHNNQGSGYWNGDGLSSEETNPGIAINGFTSKGHTDGGIDLKSSASVIGLVVGDNKRNIKLWNGKFDIQSPVISAPNERGNGSGSPTHVNLNNNQGAGTLPEVRLTNADLRLFGQAGAFEFDLDTTLIASGAIIKLINVQRDASPVVNNNGSHIRFMTAATAPTGSPTITTSSANLNDGSGASIALASNRDAAHGGIIIRSIGGASGSLFKVDGIGGTAQSFSPVSPIAYTGTGADAKAITLNIEDIAGNTASISYTVNVVPDTTDYRVLDVTFTGADNTAGAADVSPAPKTLTYGSAAKIRTTIDAAGRLRVPFTANGTGTGKVSAVDSPDWYLNGAFTIIATQVNMDTAVTGLAQTVVAQHSNSGSGRSWWLGFSATGQPQFQAYADGTNQAFALTDPTVRSDTTDYDLKVTRRFISGSTYQWDLYVNGVSVANVQNTTVLFDAPTQLSIGATATSRDYMAGYIKRVAVHKGTQSGT